MPFEGLPPKQGLYDPQCERDSCGVGFVVNVDGTRSNHIIRQALEVLWNMNHRGACGCDPESGDGAGILMQIPQEFLRRECREIGLELPTPGDYAVGMVFLPPNPLHRQQCQEVFERIVQQEGHRLLGWRDVPVDSAAIGSVAHQAEPVIRQVFIRRNPALQTEADFERKLYVLRRLTASTVESLGIEDAHYYYVPSLSSVTVVYKGQLTARQVDQYYLDLKDPLLKSALALVHSRFSTNTFPSWKLAHPFRYLAHNGEINALRGNRNWMRARTQTLASDLLGNDLQKLFPVVTETGSDSATLDNALEFLVAGGRSLTHAIMMLIPEAWNQHCQMGPDKRAFYEYHACMMEPWDGPAAVAFTDGKSIGAILDRNGLRPARYVVTKENLVIMASEVGVLDIPPEEIVSKGRLQPGKLFLVDTVQGRIVDDAELKERVVQRGSYGQWLEANRIRLKDLPNPELPQPGDAQMMLVHQKAFGYTAEDLRLLMAPMARDGEEAVGSMGTDTPLAVLSNQPQLLYNYFKQLFAQVTNPPIDSIREELVMALDTYLGSEQNLLAETPEHCRMVHLTTPILTDTELEKIRRISVGGFRAVTLPMLFPVAEGEKGLEPAVGELCQKASEAIRDGYSILILSDRGINNEWAPIPSLLAVSGVHHHLVREGTRTKASLVVESGEARETMHFALLIGYGAGAVNPYLAFATLTDMVRQRLFPE